MPQKLLLADDSVTIQRVIELTFADEDVQLTAVGDGKLAIESIEADPPDIVLADVGMPEKDGYEVAAYIKNNPRLAHIPVLLLTGAFEPVDEERARAAGCDGVLAKPFEPQMVITRVKELLADVARSRAPRRGPAMSVAPTAGEAGTPAAADDEFLLPEIAAFEAGSAPAEGSAASQLLAELDQRDADGPSEADAGDEAGDEAADGPVPDDYSVEVESPLDAAVQLRRRQPMVVPEFSAPRVDTEAPAVHEAILSTPIADVPPSSGGAALDDYFSRLDAAFSTLNQGADVRPSASEPPAPLAPLPTFAPATFEPPSPASLAPLGSEPVEAARDDAGVSGSFADAFSALLAAERGETGGVASPLFAASPAPQFDMEELVERVTREVLARMSERVVRETVTDIVSRVTERLVREEIDRVKASLT